jgi:hypothetical protein
MSDKKIIDSWEGSTRKEVPDGLKTGSKFIFLVKETEVPLGMTSWSIVIGKHT